MPPMSPISKRQLCKRQQKYDKKQDTIKTELQNYLSTINTLRDRIQQRKNVKISRKIVGKKGSEKERESHSSDPLPSNFHVAFHTFMLLSPSIKSTLITWKFLKTKNYIKKIYFIHIDSMNIFMKNNQLYSFIYKDNFSYFYGVFASVLNPHLLHNSFRENKLLFELKCKLKFIPPFNILETFVRKTVSSWLVDKKPPDARFSQIGKLRISFHPKLLLQILSLIFNFVLKQSKVWSDPPTSLAEQSKCKNLIFSDRILPFKVIAEVLNVFLQITSQIFVKIDQTKYSY